MQQVAVLDIKFVVNTPSTKITTNNANGFGAIPQRLSTIRFAIILPAPVLPLHNQRAIEPANSRIVFISIDLTAAFR